MVIVDCLRQEVEVRRKVLMTLLLSLIYLKYKVKYFPNIDACVVTANISKNELENIVDNLTLKEVYPLLFLVI